MGILFLAALIIGAGTLGVQLLSSGDSHDADAHDADGHDGGVLPLVLGLRFWTFGLLAFGFSGSLLYYLGLLGSIPAALVAAASGVASGLLASWTIQRLKLGHTSSGAEAGDLIGQVARVLVPVAKGQRGKVRVELRGQTLDFIATTDDEALEAGSIVLIEELRGNDVHVSRAGQEFLPRELP